MKKIKYVTVKPTKVTRRRVEVIICDLCNDGHTKGGYVNGGTTCYICKRDVCANHREYDPYYDGDYPDRWCTICYQLNIKYHEEKINLEAIYDAAIEKIDRKIKRESLESIIS